MNSITLNMGERSQFSRRHFISAVGITTAAIWLMAGSKSLEKQGPEIDGLTSVESRFGPKETTDRLEAEVRARGLKVFARIDHAAGAREAGLELRPTEVIIFGNARGGTPLMQASQTAGIDLPLKALVWQDAANKTWISYNEPNWIARRHHPDVQAEIIDKLSTVLGEISRKAAGAYSPVR